MAFIYEIYNDINDMIYIGMTQSDEMTPAQKLRQHIQDRNKEMFQNKKAGEPGYRPMYNDMNKYGTKYFHIRVLCHCTSEEAPTKEKEYIALYPSEKLYNISLGGLGKSLVTQEDINKFNKLFQNGYSIEEISRITNISIDAIRKYLYQSGISKEEIKEAADISKGKRIKQFSLDGKFIKEYLSSEEAGRAINKSGSHIRAVCRGERKIAYGYIWQYA